MDGGGVGDEEVEQLQELLPPAPAVDEQSRGKEVGLFAHGGKVALGDGLIRLRGGAAGGIGDIPGAGRGLEAVEDRGNLRIGRRRAGGAFLVGAPEPGPVDNHFPVFPMVAEEGVQPAGLRLTACPFGGRPVDAIAQREQRPERVEVAGVDFQRALVGGGRLLEAPLFVAQHAEQVVHGRAGAAGARAVSLDV